MLNFIEISLGTGGVARCTLCAGVPSAARPLHDIRMDVAQLPQHLDGVVLGSFEPFLHPELVSVIELLTKGAIPRIMICTDGGALSHMPNVQGSLSSGVRLFEVVVVGGDPVSHDTLTNAPGLYEAACLGIKNVRSVASALNLDAEVVGVARICTHNSHALVDIVSTFVRCGVTAVRVCAELGVIVDPVSIALASEIATSAGVALFGDGCESYIQGARLYNTTEVQR